MIFKYGTDNLTVDKVINIANNNLQAIICNDASKNIIDSRKRVETMANGNKAIYGINTGFGPMAQFRISDKELSALQYNLVRSHANGAGNRLPDEYVKAVMISRLNTLLLGVSGVSMGVVTPFQAFINNDVIPEIFEHGSVGASGDLVQLAHLALCLIGEGYVYENGVRTKTAEVLKKKGIAPLLTRIDTFLRPKTLRHMFAQKSGVNFEACIESNKIVLIKLSQGLIGSENSYLLGSLFLSKLHQAAQSRQQLEKSQRNPFYVYLDDLMKSGQIKPGQKILGFIPESSRFLASYVLLTAVEA